MGSCQALYRFQVAKISITGNKVGNNRPWMMHYYSFPDIFVSNFLLLFKIYCVFNDQLSSFRMNDAKSRSSFILNTLPGYLTRQRKATSHINQTARNELLLGGMDCFTIALFVELNRAGHLKGLIRSYILIFSEVQFSLPNHGSSLVQIITLGMMTSANRNIFRVTGPLCGEFTGHRWIPSTKASDAELWCFLWYAPE